MTKRELVLSTLEKMGFRPEVDDDGEITITYQMKLVCFGIGDDEEPYIPMVLPQFHEIEEGQETPVLVTCNKMTRDLKLVKVFVDQSFQSVSATCEFFYTDEESLTQNIRQSLQIFGVVRTLFRESLSGLSDEK